MAELVDDEVLEEFGIIASVDEVATRVMGRFGDVVDRFSFYSPEQMDHEYWSEIKAELRSFGAAD
jgi:hypothetical protein